MVATGIVGSLIALVMNGLQGRYIEADNWKL